AIAATACKAAVEVAKGQNASTLITTSLCNAASALGVTIPPTAQTALSSGLDLTYRLGKGEKVDSALANTTLDNGPNLIPGLNTTEKTQLKNALKIGFAMGHAVILQ